MSKENRIRSVQLELVEMWISTLERAKLMDDEDRLFDATRLRDEVVRSMKDMALVLRLSETP